MLLSLPVKTTRDEMKMNLPVNGIIPPKEANVGLTETPVQTSDVYITSQGDTAA